MDEIKQILAGRFQRVPREIQNFLLSDQLGPSLAALGRRHNLYLDKLTWLENEVVMILLGIKKPNDLPVNMPSRLGVSPDEAAQISQEIDNELFWPIREKIKGLTEALDAEAARQEPPPDLLTQPPLQTPPASNLSQATDKDREPGAAISDKPQATSPNPPPASNFDQKFDDPYREPPF